MRPAVCFALFVFIQWFSPPFILSDTEFIIKLRNGNTINTSAYSEEGSIVYYKKYGTRIGISKKDVVEITEHTTEKASQDTETIEYLGYKGPPKYFRATGFPDNYYSPHCNGWYEEYENVKDFQSYIHYSGEFHIFRYLNNEKKPGWYLGRVRDPALNIVNDYNILYSNLDAPTGSGPDSWGQWTTGSGKGKPLRDVKIVAASPPETVNQGVYVYIARNFPFAEVNGPYKPNRVLLGKILYRHENNKFEMYYNGRWGWVIKNLETGRIAYQSVGSLRRNSLPEQVEQWIDINRREIDAVVRRKTIE